MRSYEVQIDKPGPAGGKLHIVMASDMHFGYLSGKRHAERMVQEINALRPDLILLPGDIVDDDVRPYKDKGLGAVLAKLELRLVCMLPWGTTTGSRAGQRRSSAC